MSIEKLWYGSRVLPWLLFPFALLFKLVTAVRRFFYRTGLLKSYRSSKPVIVVGNISVGGNGKTPVVIYLVEQLARMGLKAGVVSRGYGGKAPRYPHIVNENSTPAKCGDEPFMIYKRCHCPVVVDPDRVAAVKKMEKKCVDVIISDDGLQHYAMQRDYEIVVVDGKRRFGNGYLMPMGPLRESISRLKTVDAVIANGGKGSEQEYAMVLKPGKVVKVSDFASPYDEEGTVVTAVAGIGNPRRFFNTLKKIGFKLAETHAWPDHSQYDQTTILAAVDDVSKPIIMTEKDAVKCRSFACNNWYFLPVDAVIDPRFMKHLLTKLGFGSSDVQQR